MIKIIGFLVISVTALVFSVLNTHPVTVNMLPGTAVFIQCRTAVFYSILTGFIAGGFLFIPRLLRLKRRIGILKKNNEQARLEPAPAVSE
jgi:uncharacterized integral membrane protein